MHGIVLGFSLDWSYVDRDTMLNAAAESVVDGMAFNNIVVQCKIDEH